MDVVASLIDQIKNKKRRIVFPEGEDVRVLKAVVRLKYENIIEPILLGSRQNIIKICSENKLDISGIDIINPLESEKINDYASTFCELRNNKETIDDARSLMRKVNYFGAMMLQLDEVDGMVSGAVHSSGDTIRPTLQIIKTKPGVSRVSGVMLMMRGNQKYLYADIAVNTMQLESDILAEIAVESAKTAKMFGIDPKIAMLSFSTKGSANSIDTVRMAEATKIARKLAPWIEIDGEIQFDAAIIDEIGQSKASGSPVAGQANVFIFPNIDAGNIAYKITQYLAGFEALGPLLQGLNKPVNDLSRGATSDDIYKVAIITAAQSMINFK